MSVKLELQNKQNINKEKTKKNNILNVMLPIFIGIVILAFLFLMRSSTVTGRIMTSNDNKVILKDVKITLDNIKIITGNYDGTYKITGLKQGKHEIRFEKEGYETLTQNINLQKGEEFIFDAYLTQINSKVESKNLFTGLMALSMENIAVSQFSESYKDIYLTSSGGILQLNDNLYILDLESSYVRLIDSSGHQIKQIELPKGIKSEKLYVTSLRDKIYTIFKDNNSIGIIDLNKNEFILESVKLASKIHNLFINKVNNRAYILSDKNIYLFNIMNSDIKPIIPNSSGADKLSFYKSFIFITDKINQELIKLDSYNMDKESIKYKLNFIPENILVTNSEKLYISSGKNLYLVDPETGNTNKTIDTGVNIVNMKVSPQDDNIYISDNTEKIHIFDTKNDELLKDSITFKMPVKEVFFPE